MEEYMVNNDFRWLISNARHAIPEERGGFYWHKQAMGGIAPSCCKFQSFGDGHGGTSTAVCSNAPSMRRQICWVVSLGFNGDWGFERDVVRNTACNLHIFSCVGAWRVPNDLKERVKIHKKCIGTRDNVHKDSISWERILETGGGSLPALLKMDIEGHEFPVLKEMITDDKFLPDQIVADMHLNKAIAVDIERHFIALREAGYRVVHRADSPNWEQCSAVTLLKLDSLL